MAVMNSFESAALRLLAKRIEEVKRVNADDLAGGNGFVLNDLVATGGNYYSSVAYIRALNHVLEWAKDVENELLGRGLDKS